MIIIPMAGLSSRFTKAGYTKPKYMLDAHGRSLFDHAVRSFENYFDEEEFLFVFRDVQDTASFLHSECEQLGIRNYRMICLNEPTRGQAETVAIALTRAEVSSDTSLTIFNIDTFRLGFVYPEFLTNQNVAGYLEVFQGEGSNWSFAKLKDGSKDQVLETAEKKPISNLCCSGLYYFRSTGEFLESFWLEAQRPLKDLDANELYVAPLYNYLIRAGKDIRVNVITASDVIFCGVPNEYTFFLSQRQ